MDTVRTTEIHSLAKAILEIQVLMLIKLKNCLNSTCKLGDFSVLYSFPVLQHYYWNPKRPYTASEMNPLTNNLSNLESHLVSQKDGHLIVIISSKMNKQK